MFKTKYREGSISSQPVDVLWEVLHGYDLLTVASQGF